jgi:hypothetical protein
VQKERLGFEISEVERSFGVLGPVEVVCQPRGFTRWCTLPYPRHVDGCPNFGKRTDCPPNVPYYLDVFEPLSYVAYLDFDFEGYIEQRRLMHNDWSEKSLWQVPDILNT